jgi:hypothetical protein
MRIRQRSSQKIYNDACPVDCQPRTAALGIQAENSSFKNDFACRCYLKVIDSLKHLVCPTR